MELRVLSYPKQMGFKENLKSQLDYSGMLVKELAAHSKIKKKTIDSYLGIKAYSPSVENAVSIANALGVSVEYLVTGEDYIKGTPLTSLPAEIQEIVSISKQLNQKERYIILNLARILINQPSK